MNYALLLACMTLLVFITLALIVDIEETRKWDSIEKYIREHQHEDD